MPGQKKSIEAIIARIDNRIAFACMDTCLALNGIELSYDTAETGDLIVRAARGIVDETALATWLRQL